MKRTIILVTLVLFLATIFAPIAAVASSKGRRNTAIALTAVSIYSIAKGKTTQGLVLGAGSYYAWKKYNDAREKESRRKYYRSGYKQGYKDNAKRVNSSRYRR